MVKRTIALALLLAGAGAIWLARSASWQTDDGAAAAPIGRPAAAAAASAPVAVAGSAVPGVPSRAVAAAAPSAGENVQTDDEQTEAESCDAQWPGCPCPKDLSVLHITPPAGMSLASGSCSLQSGSISLGSFTFAGNLTLTGTLEYSADEMTEHLTFWPDALPAPSRNYTQKQWQQFAGALDSLRVNEWNDFALPELSEQTPCMRAPAVIKVSEIEVLIGSTDEEGNWLRRYQVVKIGKFSKC